MEQNNEGTSKVIMTVLVALTVVAFGVGIFFTVGYCTKKQELSYTNQQIQEKQNQGVAGDVSDAINAWSDLLK